MPTTQVIGILVSSSIAFAPAEAPDPFETTTTTETAQPAEPPPPAAVTPVEPAAPPAIPGVPAGVDLFDESTWSELSPEQKDKLRALRAEQRYQAAQAGEAPQGDAAPATTGRAKSDEANEIAELRADHRRFLSRAESQWAEQDGRLVTATAITGVFWGIGVAATIAMAVSIGKKADACVDQLSNGGALGGSGDDCSAEAGRSARRLAVGTYVVGSMTGVLGVSFLVSGILLGVHRSNRPEWAVARGKARLAVTHSGLRLRF